jgi:hypothetical protein
VDRGELLYDENPQTLEVIENAWSTAKSSVMLKDIDLIDTFLFPLETASKSAWYGGTSRSLRLPLFIAIQVFWEHGSL